MIEAKNAVYAYKGSKGRALGGVSLSVAPGERVCVLGANGSGKSTLARLFAGVCFASSGTVEVDGTAFSPDTVRALARKVGYVAQDPRLQPMSSLVLDEVAFALRCAGLSPKRTRGAATEALTRCGISQLANCSTSELSGGQQQLVGIAAAVAAHPAYLVLDDATSMLDSTSAKGVGELIDDLAKGGTGVLEVTNNLLRAMGAHRLCLLEKGALAWTGTFDAFIADERLLGSLGLTRTPLATLLRAVQREGFRFSPGTTADDIVSFIKANRLASRLAEYIRPAKPAEGDMPAHEISLEGAGVVYDANAALKDVSLSVGDELVVIAGPAGSGKTTCGAALAGILPLDEGTARFDVERARAGRVGIALQYPHDQFVAATVRDDIAFGARNTGVGSSKLDTVVSHMAEDMGISSLLDRSAFGLSGGEARRAALAGIEALRPPAFVFDEPCAGLDPDGRSRVRKVVRSIRSLHRPVVVISSDVEDWLDLASRVVFLREGSIACECSALEAQTSTQPYLSCGLEPPLSVSIRSLAGWGSRRGGSRV